MTTRKKQSPPIPTLMMLFSGCGVLSLVDRPIDDENDDLDNVDNGGDHDGFIRSRCYLILGQWELEFSGVKAQFGGGEGESDHD